MYALLLVLGAVAIASGIALIASGVPVQEFDYGGALVIAGTAACVGGFILIGIAFLLRELQRIGRVLVARPMPQMTRPAEAPAVAAAAAAATTPAVAAPSAPARIPFPPKPKIEPRPAAEPAVAAPAPEETAFDRLRQKFPSLGRIESAPVVEATEVSLSPRTPPRAEEYVDEARQVAPPGRTNGSEAPEPAPNVTRLEVPPRPAPPERPSKIAIFDSFWPKDARRGKQEQPAEPAAPVVEPIAESPPRLAEGVTILKSGVVDGMAYTLYSDGSIEAQLPQGTLRFGSITELRLHLEKHG